MPDPIDTETLAEVRLTDAEREALMVALPNNRPTEAALREHLAPAVERILAARIVQARAGEGALRERVDALADEWDAADEHGNPLREGSFGEAADDLRAALTTAGDQP